MYRACAVVLVAVLFMSATVEGQSCSNPVFSNPNEWDVDSRFGELLNLQTTAAPQMFNATGTSGNVCQYFQGQDVCCGNAMLVAIETALNTTRTAINAAKASINNEELFQQMFDSLSLIGGNSTIQQDIADLHTAINALQSSQTECVLSLVGYTEGMMCFACSANASQFVDAATLSFLLSADTCSGVTSSCLPLFDSASNVLDVIARIISRFMPVDDSILSHMPDMCGGTEAAPGNCSEYICNTVLQGVRIPNFGWDISGLNNDTMEGSVAPANLAKRMARAVSKTVAHTMAAVTAATGVKNVYVENGGYPALSVGCSGDACGTAQSSTNSNDHTVAIAVGVSVGAAALIAIIAIVAKQRGASRSSEEEVNGMLMEGQKGYRTV
eukprot:CAMPEP_0176431500 /NCGR_PEP_ID=MMETSP0127-20121128/14848_1 /TAXON_ID=938130 /ORGANISM="Platyophrya macrostoma, Strain WH" /LENGTH=383 /DNA_ID=CAMNT_0017813517 /DNA_START=60 /DNA_END=1211 /DNA_ORIENTATION=+